MNIKNGRSASSHAMNGRKSSGQATSEFGATIAVLICLVLIPVLSIAFVPIRYSMCQGVITEFVTRLAHSEKRSDAYNTLSRDERWKKLLEGCGAQVKDAKLVLIATTTNGGGKKIVLQQGNAVPPEWLPGGKLSPCIYSLHLDCQCAVSPLFGGTGTIVGINAPVLLNASSSAHWENLSRNPRSADLAFCINE